jgi:hypothetical protein
MDLSNAGLRSQPVGERIPSTEEVEDLVASASLNQASWTGRGRYLPAAEKQRLQYGRIRAKKKLMVLLKKRNFLLEKGL